MKKDLGSSRLHLCLESSMSSSTPLTNVNDDGSSEPSPVDDSLGGDFEKLSLGQYTSPEHHHLTSGMRLDEEEETPPSWFLKHMKKMEENLQAIIHQEIQRCLEDVLSDHLNGQLPTDQNKKVPDTEQVVPEFKSSVRPRKGYDSSESVHLGITCDNCEQPVSGIRFKCGNCVDFDLCETCEGIPGVHQSDHVFLKIRRPTSLATFKQRGEKRKALLRHLYPQLGQVATAQSGPGCETVTRCRKREKKVKRWLSHAENIFTGPWHQDRRNHRSGIQGASRSSSHMAAASQSYSVHARHPSSVFLDSPAKHLTEVSPSGVIVIQPGQEFDKEWTVRNDSQETLATSSRLRFSWGSLVPQGQVEVVVPPLRPGETGIVGPVHFRAPQSEGMYHSQFLLIGHSGSWRFPWPSLSCSVNVTWQKEKHQDEPKEADVTTGADPLFIKSCHCKKTYDTPIDSVAQEATESLTVPPVETEVKLVRPSASSSNNNNTTDPEETDDTASILSISSCDSDDDYVKVQGPTQFTVSSASIFSKVPIAPSSNGAPLESQATSSSSIDLLSDMPLVEEETGQRSQASVYEPLSPQKSVSEVHSAEHSAAVSRRLVEKRVSEETGVRETTAGRGTELSSNARVVSQETGAPEDAELRVQSRRTSSPSTEQPERPQPPRRRGMITEDTNTQEMMIPVLPEGLVTGALTAAASVYNTARALISNLQPPTDHHASSDSQRQPQMGPPGPMSQLIEMGFHDRELNQRLLTEKKGCLEDVVAELIRLRPDYSLNID